MPVACIFVSVSARMIFGNKNGPPLHLSLRSIGFLPSSFFVLSISRVLDYSSTRNFRRVGELKRDVLEGEVEPELVFAVAERWILGATPSRDP